MSKSLDEVSVSTGWDSGRQSIAVSLNFSGRTTRFFLSEGLSKEETAVLLAKVAASLMEDHKLDEAGV